MKKHFCLLCFLFPFLLAATFASAAELGLSGGFEYSKSSALFGGTKNISFVPGVRLQDTTWFTTAYWPIFLSQGSAQGSTMSSGMGFGDFYWGGSFQLFNEEQTVFGLWPQAQVKAPLASSDNGTGKWDFGLGLACRKTLLSQFFVFCELDYINTGDPSDTVYKNPLSYGVSFGTVLADGFLSFLASYRGMTSILEGQVGQKQASLGANFRLSRGLFLSTVYSKGLSDSTPSTVIDAGFTVYF